MPSSSLLSDQNEDDQKNVIVPPDENLKKYGEMGKPVVLPESIKKEKKKQIDRGWSVDFASFYLQICDAALFLFAISLSRGLLTINLIIQFFYFCRLDNAFNQYISDLISVKRTLPDVRDPG